MSFSSSHGRYGVKKTSARASGVRARVDRTVSSRAAWQWWLKSRSARMRVSNLAGEGEVGSERRAVVGAPKAWPATVMRLWCARERPLWRML